MRGRSYRQGKIVTIMKSVVKRQRSRNCVLLCSMFTLFCFIFSVTKMAKSMTRVLSTCVLSINLHLRAFSNTAQLKFS